PLPPASCRFVRRLRPPAPPFPYTTLFRSVRVCRRVDVRRVSRGGVRRDRAVHVAIGVVGAAGVRSRVGLRREGQGIAGEKRGERDRKSTRLNSSHVKISYAVFCLKKKTKR